MDIRRVATNDRANHGESLANLRIDTGRDHEIRNSKSAAILMLITEVPRNAESEIYAPTLPSEKG